MIGCFDQVVICLQAPGLSSFLNVFFLLRVVFQPVTTIALFPASAQFAVT